MKRRERTQVETFADAYKQDINKRVFYLTGAGPWAPSQASRIVTTRRIPIVGPTLAAIDRLHVEEEMDFGCVAARSIRSYCMIDSARLAGIRLVLRERTGRTLDIVIGAKEDDPLDLAGSGTLQMPADSVMAQLNKLHEDRLEEQADELALLAQIQGYGLDDEYLEDRLISMPANAEAAMQRVLETPGTSDVHTVNRAIVLFDRLHLFKQVAEVGLCGSDNMAMELGRLAHLANVGEI